MEDGVCVQPLALLSWASRSAQSSCDFDHLFVWTQDSQGSHLLRTEEKAQ